MAVYEIDIAIIGAGVVGLAIAARVSGKKSVIVLEKNGSFGQETSSRNSEVIHSGIYYPDNTLKARFSVEGRKLLYEICQKNNIPCRRTEKLIVASDVEENESLERLLAQGRNNGVADLEIAGRRRLKELEPNVDGISALYSPQTGILDSHRLMQFFMNKANDEGCAVVFNSEVVGIEKLSDSHRVTVRNNGELSVLKAQIVVNCAGLDADKIAEMAGIDAEKENCRIYYCRGQYFRVSNKKSALINRLIYPVPEPKSAGLGIHATLDMSGGLRLGPDSQYLKEREKDYSVDDSRLQDFYDSARKILPFIEPDDLAIDMAGIRPKLSPEGDFRDFIIREESERGLPGFINLIGIESPGLTASPAIARYVEGLIRGRGIN